MLWADEKIRHLNINVMVIGNVQIILLHEYITMLPSLDYLAMQAKSTSQLILNFIRSEHYQKVRN